MVKRYRKKPVVIEAVRYTGNNGSELKRWSDNNVLESPVLEPDKDNPTGAYVQVKVLEGTMIGLVGDYIIKGVAGEFYPCKPDIFEATYVEVES